jgi:hypothetical protein
MRLGIMRELYNLKLFNSYSISIDNRNRNSLFYDYHLVFSIRNTRYIFFTLFYYFR